MNMILRAVSQRYLLVAEHGRAWPIVAEHLREQGAEVAVLPHERCELEPTFARRLSIAIARAQLEGRTFTHAALVVNDQLGPHSEPARTRLLSLLAQSLLRAAQPVVIYVDCPEGASAPLRRSIERIHHTVAREFRSSTLLTLRLGTPDAAGSIDEAAALATG